MPESTQVVEGRPNREMRRGLHSVVQCNAAQQGRGFRPGFVVDHFPVGALQLLPGGGGNRAGLHDRARRLHSTFLKAEVVQEQEAQEAEAPRRTRQTKKIASRLNRQESVGRVQLRVVVVRDDEEEFLEDRGRVRRIFRQLIEELNPLLVVERWQEREQSIEVLRCHAPKERSRSLLGCGSWARTTLMGNRDFQRRSCPHTTSSSWVPAPRASPPRSTRRARTSRRS